MSRPADARVWFARFTVFDGAGLLVMGAAFVLLGGRTPARSA